jgi:hypothetical protein
MARCYIHKNEELRKELSNICSKHSLEDYSKQIQRIKELKEKYGHCIKLIKKISYEETADVNKAYKCFEYCFDFYLRDIKEIHRGFFYKPGNSINDFISSLISRHLELVDQCDARDGDHIIYFVNNRPVHAGRWESGKVKSKWEEYHLWEHDIFELPLYYGCNAVFYKKISKDKVIQYMKEWLINKEINL